MFKTASALFVALFCVWCGSSAMDESHRQDSSPRAKLPRSIDAFGGELVGRDAGEFGGGLVFRDSKGQEYKLLPRVYRKDGGLDLAAPNVRGIGINGHGVFVFTGLAHLGIGSGSIHQVHQTHNGEIKVNLVTRLPGAPANIQQREDHSFRFVVHEGRLRSKEPSRKLCMSFDGESATESNDCGHAEC